MSSDQERTRNFCIIAHIDHGKSTLADRILEMTHTIGARQMREQVLDQMDLERERGITIKASAIRLVYHARDGQEYLLNLIDTPGHVDFTYEVSRSLAAAEGAILVIDAVSGVEAQTVANVHLAEEQKLEIVPVINKIDLPNASPERARLELEEIIGIPGEEAILASAKMGDGVEDVLEAVVARIPAPPGDPEAPLQALIFDSHFDPHRGIVAYVRVRNGRLTPGMQIQMMSIRRRFEVQEIGVFGLGLQPIAELAAGSVGY
ncbi:MAG: GTP-binding protein, partial [Armatimonadetes bacterium]|nr:GTP-binding protein [Armatimonadota bacterium]